MAETTIGLSKKTKMRLHKFKLVTRESDEAALNKVLEMAEKVKQEIIN